MGLKASDIAAIGLGAGASVVAAIENKSVDGISQTDPALTILQDRKLIKIVVDTRTMKGQRGAVRRCDAGRPVSMRSPSLFSKTPNTAQALATAIVRADEWLQTATPADVAKSGAGHLPAGRPGDL